MTTFNKIIVGKKDYSFDKDGEKRTISLNTISLVDKIISENSMDLITYKKNKNVHLCLELKYLYILTNFGNKLDPGEEMMKAMMMNFVKDFFLPVSGIVDFDIYKIENIKAGNLSIPDRYFIEKENEKNQENEEIQENEEDKKETSNLMNSFDFSNLYTELSDIWKNTTDDYEDDEDDNLNDFIEDNSNKIKKTEVKSINTLNEIKEDEKLEKITDKSFVFFDLILKFTNQNKKIEYLEEKLKSSSEDYLKYLNIALNFENDESIEKENLENIKKYLKSVKKIDDNCLEIEYYLGDNVLSLRWSQADYEMMLNFLIKFLKYLSSSDENEDFIYNN